MILKINHLLSPNIFWDNGKCWMLDKIEFHVLGRTLASHYMFHLNEQLLCGMFGPFKYTLFILVCLNLNLQTLQVRRTKLSLNFGLKCIASEKFNHLFKLNSHVSIRNPDRFDVPFAKTSRYYDSPKLYLTRLLNSYFRNEETLETRLL